jgi:hypothetical protein
LTFVSFTDRGTGEAAGACEISGFFAALLYAGLGRGLFALTDSILSVVPRPFMDEPVRFDFEALAIVFALSLLGSLTFPFRVPASSFDTDFDFDFLCCATVDFL